MKLKVITPPATEPLDLGETKKYLRVTSSDDDVSISDSIKQAREYCEEYQNRKYIPQTIEGYLDRFPSGRSIVFSVAPVKSISSIKYTDNEGNEVEVDSSIYDLDNISYVNKIDLNHNKSWPSAILKPTNGVKVTFIAGYETVPETMRTAMKIHIQLLYDQYKPSEQAKMEQTRDNLLSMNKVW